ncbi:MAG: branched-chain amino acid ABC transporter permease [Oscillospiraceae bacterium]|jgi:branched-chain amino acid transport system permease protein|nr:branched-chain amino acid ABC transporter permease [Oscillospiraceae bacterium]
MEGFIQQLINGIIMGSFYALVALGYSMVYGIIKLLNFAHGDIYMVGAFSCLTIFGVLSVFVPDWGGVILSILAAMFLAAILGYLSQRFAYRPLLGAPRLSLLITAIGVSLIISNSVMAYTNARPSFFADVIDNTRGFNIGDIRITYIQIIVIAVSAALMLILTLFISRTMTGKAMRAIALDKDTCRLMGVNVNRIIALTFMIGSALAAVAGGLFCIRYGGPVQFSMGFMIGIKAFTAAVIGGIGSIPGAMLGGLLLGVLEAMGTQFIGSEWQDVFAFGILILILILRPNGLMGRTEIERM